MGKENNNIRTGGMSRNMESLRAMADMMNDDILNKNEENSQFSDKPEGKPEKTIVRKISPSNGKSSDINKLVKCIKTIEEEDDANAYTSCRIRVSIAELLDELKAIPEFKGYNKGDILGAALYTFVDNNREILREKKNNRFSSL